MQCIRKIFTFYLNWWFKKKNGGLEKIKFLCLSLLKKQAPQRISLVVQPPTFISFKKNSSLQFKKFEEGEDQKQWSIVLNPEFFCTYFTAYWSRTEGQPPWFGVLEAHFANLASKVLDSKFGQPYWFNGTRIRTKLQ